MAILQSPRFLRALKGYFTNQEVPWRGLDAKRLTEDLEALNVTVSGSVNSVNSGTDITVDNTDPSNPIVNFTGSSGSNSLSSVLTVDDDAIGLNIDNLGILNFQGDIDIASPTGTLSVFIDQTLLNNGQTGDQLLLDVTQTWIFNGQTGDQLLFNATKTSLDNGQTGDQILFNPSKITFANGQTAETMFLLQDAGWTIHTGIGSKAAFDADWTVSIGAVVSQSEAESIRDQVMAIQRALAAMQDHLMTNMALLKN